MKKIAIALGFILSVGIGTSRAGAFETLRASSGITDLQKTGISLSLGSSQNINIPLSGQPQPVRSELGAQHGNSRHGHWGIPAPQSGHNGHNDPWDTGEAAPRQTIKFESDNFGLITDAEQSMNNTLRQLWRARYFVLEKYFNTAGPRYTLVFQAPAQGRVYEYASETSYASYTESEQAAAGAVAMFRSQGMIILEKNVNRMVSIFTPRAFVIRYFNPND